ncbi:hypothetical protein [Niallia oryzisoli]|uniref:hypothetical protein n=1 Tax=Niallia oryzisoli TaxID=1737571 RepID=UPI003735AEAE
MWSRNDDGNSGTAQDLNYTYPCSFSFYVLKQNVDYEQMVVSGEGTETPAKESR